jgi:phage-related protein
MKVYFFEREGRNSPIIKFIDKLPSEDQARFLEVIDEIEMNGFGASWVSFKPIQGKLWEVKFKGEKSGYRILYVMICLHAFNKKSRKTPKRDLKLAIKRMKEILS